MMLYNTLTRQKDSFVPLVPGKARVYSCGPTVYWFAHIGNMRAFICADVLCRALRFKGFEVEQVMNITDVGHLTNDSDDGEDKMLISMRREGKTAYEIAAFYTEQFFRDIQSVNVIPAKNYPRATEHIAEQIAMVEQLEKNGFTYRTSDGIYFDTSKLEHYGQLSGQKSEEKQAGARVEMGEKKQVTDFALWKFSPEQEKREMEWSSPWGVGFPGWHLECSAMSKKYLGVPFDIHTGGVDHIAVHHENELAQTFGADGVLEANYWMHNEFITVDGGKMSKSLGNVFAMADVVERGFHPLAFRYLCLGAHYRTKLNFTWEALGAAQTALSNVYEKLRVLPMVSSSVEITDAVVQNAMGEFSESIENDVNTAQALAAMWKLLGHTEHPEQVASALLRMDEVLGLQMSEVLGVPEAAMEIPPEVQELLEERAQARGQKQWAQSDILRDRLAELGFVVEDKSDGQHLRRV